MMKITYTDGYKYQLEKDYFHRLSFTPGIDAMTDWITLYEDGRLTIRKGYAWDGPSGPTYDSKSSMRGSLVHDALYQLMREELLPRMWREECDVEMKKIYVDDGMWKWRAWLWLKSVRKAASFAASPKNKKKQYTAP